MIIHHYQLEMAIEHIAMMKKLHELGKKEGYEEVNAILASPFYFLRTAFLIVLI